MRLIRVSREEYQQFTQTMRELMRNCLDFFVSVGMEKSGPTKENQAYEEMVKRLQGITVPTGGLPDRADKQTLG